MTILKEYRQKAGITQEELAMRSGVKLSTLQKLETGKNSLNGAAAETVLRLARALGVSVEALVIIDE